MVSRQAQNAFLNHRTRWLRRLRSNRLETSARRAGSRPSLVEPVETTARKAGSRPCGHLDELDERDLRPSPGVRGFETGAERLPQPPARAPGWLRRLRSNRLETTAAKAGSRPSLVEPVETTAGKAGSRPCGHLDELDERVLRPSPGVRGFETGAERLPQPPAAQNAFLNHRRRRTPSSTTGGAERLPQPPDPVVEEVAQQPSRNLRKEGGEPTIAGRACRDHRREGWEPTLRDISTSSMSGTCVPAPAYVVSRQAQNAFLNHRRRRTPSSTTGGAERLPQPPAAQSAFLNHRRRRAPSSTTGSAERPSQPPGSRSVVNLEGRGAGRLHRRHLDVGDVRRG